MLYYLFNYLDQLDFPGAGMFKYVSFRSGLALILSLFISTAIGRKIIDRLQYLQIGKRFVIWDLRENIARRERLPWEVLSLSLRFWSRHYFVPD